MLRGRAKYRRFDSCTGLTPRSAVKAALVTPEKEASSSMNRLMNETVGDLERSFTAARYGRHAACGYRAGVFFHPMGASSRSIGLNRVTRRSSDAPRIECGESDRSSPDGYTERRLVEILTRGNERGGE